MPIKMEITPEEAVTFLNDLLKEDQNALGDLLHLRVPCNLDMANHPTVQVSGRKGDMPPYRIGFLGILNGMFGIHERTGYGIITAIINDEEPHEIQYFRITDFSAIATPEGKHG